MTQMELPASRATRRLTASPRMQRRKGPTMQMSRAMAVNVQLGKSLLQFAREFRNGGCFEHVE